MARIARIVIPDVAHHITQRGVRRINIFDNAKDKRSYIKILSELSLEEQLEIHAYCLMDNHVHLLVVPKKEDSLRKVIGETHRLYTRMINFRKDVRGHLFQERFFSCPLDETHYISTARYIERNPVRAKMCDKAWNYEFSSAKYHVGIRSKDPLLTKKDWFYSNKEWQDFLLEDPKEIDLVRKFTKTGRPLGNKKFLESLEKLSGRVLGVKKSGRPKIN
ncbi:MAG: transposase [Rickettsiales bacterium]|nr:transposase [Rickettsiales bacterium]